LDSARGTRLIYIANHDKIPISIAKSFQHRLDKPEERRAGGDWQASAIVNPKTSAKEQPPSETDEEE
jgi:hypothetical protein